jgi:predicted CXXCH cytochrome family protein
MPQEAYEDHYKPELLSDPLYYVDGQIRDEVYEYGSFQSSRMFAKGVTCSDCHDPHTAQIRKTGNALCLQCHESRFNTPSHHFHDEGSVGSQCVSCHMPTRNYMIVDARRDHSIRIPRPDFSVSYGVPNACNGCHADKSARWAAEIVENRYGPDHRGLQQFAPQLDLIRRQLPGAETAIRDLFTDRNVPDLVKATALSEAGRYLRNGISDVVRDGLRHANPEVRIGALQALEGSEPALRWDLGAPLLGDKARSVRIEAARILGADSSLDTNQLHRLDPAWSEFIAAVRVNSDRAEWHSLYAAALAGRGDTSAAIEELQTALSLNPRFSPAYANLADVYRQTGHDDLCEQALRRGLAMDGDDALLHAAMGLLRVRQKRISDASAEFERAAKLEPSNGWYGYLYASALGVTDPVKARQFLKAALASPGGGWDRAELYLLIRMLAEQGDSRTTETYMPTIKALAIDDIQARDLLIQLTDGGS